jgi:hypothetical protein
MLKLRRAQGTAQELNMQRILQSFFFFFNSAVAFHKKKELHSSLNEEELNKNVERSNDEDVYASRLVQSGLSSDSFPPSISSVSNATHDERIYAKQESRTFQRADEYFTRIQEASKL